MNSYCQSPAYILYKTRMIRTIIHLGKLYFMVQGVFYYLSGGILLCLHPDCSAKCCTSVSVHQATLQLDAHMCSNAVFMELCAIRESACTHHFKRSLQPSQRDYWLTQRNKICSPCFERREPACNYKVSFSLATFLMADSIISAPATIWVQKRQQII